MFGFVTKIKNRFVAHMIAHFYSPVPSITEIKKDESRLFKRQEMLEGIDLSCEDQLNTFSKLTQHCNEQPFADFKQDGIRYYFNNSWFGRMDAIILYAMIREYKPKRIIEVGSGFSSCVMLDTNQLFFDNQIELTFIDPNPARLLANTVSSDKYTLLNAKAQNVSPDIFNTLERGDILFIDSSHVSKMGSDVNFLCFEIIPKLKSGVIIHFHDIAWPFEYSKSTVYDGLAWNEAYLLRALLTGSNMLRILFFSSYLGQFESHEMAKQIPFCNGDIGGSLWLERL